MDFPERAILTNEKVNVNDYEFPPTARIFGASEEEKFQNDALPAPFRPIAITP